MTFTLKPARFDRTYIYCRLRDKAVWHTDHKKVVYESSEHFAQHNKWPNTLFKLEANSMGIAFK